LGVAFESGVFQRASLRYVPKDNGRVWILIKGCKFVVQRTEQKAIAERLITIALRMVGKMNNAGLKLLAGTDTAYSYPVAGFALHDETRAVCACRTLTAGSAANGDNQSGRISAKTQNSAQSKRKAGGLILLDADPLANISNTKKINVVLNGNSFVFAHLT